MSAYRPKSASFFADSAGSEPSFESLYRSQAPYVFRALAALGVKSADVPDLVHNVFLTAHRRLPALELRSSWRAWLHGIAVRTAANYRREARHRVAPAEQLAELPSAGPEPGTGYDLLRALDALDDDQRAVFVLYEIEELSMAEVAAALGCPLTTAYSRLYAARKLIRAHYGYGANGASE